LLVEFWIAREQAVVLVFRTASAAFDVMAIAIVSDV
jgi:hypothetical protein